MSLDTLLLAWLNWYVPDGEPVAKIENVEASGKIRTLHERLIPAEIRPADDSPYEFRYIAVWCAIKLHNRGPDKLRTPPSNEDPVRSMKTHLMTLFLLFMISEGEPGKFGEEIEPAWKSQLAAKFYSWDATCASTTTEYPLEMMTENLRRQNTEKLREIERLKQEKAQADGEVRAKVERKRAQLSSVMLGRMEELKDLERERERLEQLRSTHECIQMEEQAKAGAMERLKALELEKQMLTRDIERMRVQVVEVQKIQIDLTGMEQMDLRNRCERERETMRDLEDEEKRIKAALGTVDCAERDALLIEVAKLEESVAASEPAKLREQWKAKLDAEIQVLTRGIRRLEILMDLGNYLASTEIVTAAKKA